MKTHRVAARAIVSIAVLTTAVHAIAASDDDEWPEGSAMAVGNKYVKTNDYFERLLRQRQAELVRLLAAQPDANTRLIKAIQAQQATWLRYRDDECELIGSLSGAGGSWPSTFSAQCRANLTDQRFRRFNWAIKCWNAVSAEERRFSGSRCLYQLAPLATK